MKQIHITQLEIPLNLVCSAKTIGRINSFHENLNARTAAIANPGIDKGIVILLNTPKLEHPSINAASSSSLGIVSK